MKSINSLNVTCKRMFSSSMRHYHNVFFYGNPTQHGTINMNSIDYFSITGWRENKITFYKFANKIDPVEILTVKFDNSTEAEIEYNNIINNNPPYTGF